MSGKGKVPDAWDDDWVVKADSPAVSTDSTQKDPKISKAERRAQQAELNKRLWEEAEAPISPYFVETRNNIPFKPEFKPAVKVLSRKPAPKVVSRTDAVTGLEQLTIVNDDDDDEEEEGKAKPLTAEERQLKAQKELEEKQRKYEEVRQRLFGSSGPGSGTRSPGNVTPPPSKSLGERGLGRGKGRGDVRSSSSSGIRGNKGKQLFDADYTAKPDSVYLQKRENQPLGSGQSTPGDEQTIRSPRGPDGSGRGGFGFANRGGKST